MIKIISSALFFLICFTDNVVAQRSCKQKVLHNSVVKIYSSESNTASGVVIDENLVLTVLHALPIRKKLYVDFPTYTAEAELINSHHGFDLALLKTQSDHHRKINISPAQVNNVDVFAVSYPGDAPLTVTTGRAIKTTYKGLLTSTHIEAGSSGGAIFQCQQENWKLIGIIRSFAAHRDGNLLVNSGLTWSTPSEQILNFLNFATTDSQMPLALAHQ